MLQIDQAGAPLDGRSTLSEIRARILAAPTSSAGDPDWLADAKALLAALDEKDTPMTDHVLDRVTSLAWQSLQMIDPVANREEMPGAIRDAIKTGLTWTVFGSTVRRMDEWREQCAEHEATIRAATAEVAHLKAALDARGERLTAHYNAPSERGGYVGDVFFGDEHDTTRGTHRWDGENWLPLLAPPTDREKRLAEALTEIENAPNEMEDPDAKYMQLIAHDALEAYRND